MKYLFLLTLFFSPPSFSNTQDKLYVDVHAHVACYGYNSDCYINKRMKNSVRFIYYQKLFNFSVEKAQKHGDAYLFQQINDLVEDSKFMDKVVLLSMDQIYNKDGEVQKEETEFYVPNDFVLNNTNQYESLLFGASVHPYRKDALQELERVKENGAVLIKLLPAIQHFQANDPDLKSYYLKLKELNLPLLIHMDDEHSFSKIKGEYSGPDKLELPLSLGVHIIAPHVSSLGHSNGKSNYEQLAHLSQKYPNLSADISALTVKSTRSNHLTRALNDSRWEGRLVYGSDWPLVHQFLSSPLFYILDIGFKKAFELYQIKNPWDRDILLKKALGAPEDIFLRSAEVLNLSFTHPMKASL